MSDPAERESALTRSWVANARGWEEAVRQGRIESRRVATNAAIVAAVLECRAASVLDVGCGEGWLARALEDAAVAVTGIDGSAPLVEAAREQGGGTFEICTYEELVENPDRFGGDFGAVVFNFALLHENAGPILATARRMLSSGGSLIVQTVHPWTAAGEERYVDGWRLETFDTFGSGFPDPMPWYFRTLESWSSLLSTAGCKLEKIVEPKHPETDLPLSLLLVASPARSP